MGALLDLVAWSGSGQKLLVMWIDRTFKPRRFLKQVLHLVFAGCFLSQHSLDVFRPD